MGISCSYQSGSKKPLEHRFRDAVKSFKPSDLPPPPPREKINSPRIISKKSMSIQPPVQRPRPMPRPMPVQKSVSNPSSRPIKYENDLDINSVIFATLVGLTMSDDNTSHPSHTSHDHGGSGWGGGDGGGGGGCGGGD